MKQLTGIIRAYPWGSRTALAELAGRPAPTEHPEAEAWYGAHPAAPSLLAAGDTTLAAEIAADPQGQLGAKTAAQYQGKLPFLLKLLAAAEPLSLQAHPSKAQAEAGFAAENEQGIALGSPERNYKDDNHKPELILALTPFEAMAGFRPLAQTREIVAALNLPGLDHYFAGLADAADTEAVLRGVFTTLINIPAATRLELTGQIAQSAEAFLAAQGLTGKKEQILADPVADALANLADLANRYPGDIGVLGAILLNKVNLAPGEALFLPAGQLHAYVSGFGVEIMANSDNVLRGGLTAKHVDVPELVKVLEFTENADPRTMAKPLEPCATFDFSKEVTATTFPVPTSEFALTAVEFTGSGKLSAQLDSGTIVLVTSGQVTVSAGGNKLVLQPSEAAWLPAADREFCLESTGGAVVIATNGQC